MLAQVMLLQQFLLHNRKLRCKLAREKPHIGALFQHHGIVYRIGSVFAQGKRAVRMNQHRRDLHRAYVALLEGFDNDFPVWYSYSPAISAGVISRVQGIAP